MDTTKWLNITEDEEELEDEFVSYESVWLMFPSLIISQILNSTKDTILFCIDGSRSMQSTIQPHETRPVKTGKRKKNEKNRSHFHQALQCALDVMKRKVVISPNDSLGIMFFNTVSDNA